MYSVGVDKFITSQFIASAAYVISINIHAPAVSRTPKQIDLQAIFITTAALLYMEFKEFKLS